MDRRDLLKSFAAAGPLAAAQAQARRGLPPLKITDVRTILTQVGGTHAVVVKVLTSEAGLHGVGCATHRERPLAVAAMLDQYVKPWLIGRNADEIEDIWQAAYLQPYFRSGPTGNNALSGVDGALWDILGKRTGVPVYQLLGGKVRAAVPLYAHASALDLPALTASVQKWVAQGYRHVRVQLATPGFSGYGVSGATTAEAVQKLRPDGVRPSEVFEPTPYVNNTIKMFEHLRAKLGFDVELLHDVHERVPPAHALQLARALEPYRLFFLEDPFAPEDVGWFSIMRQQTTTPLAMGELFVNRHEWLPLVVNRSIDFVRHHISAVGGLNMARKIAACCEFFNVRTAWHGPSNVSPVGHAVNMHLDLATPNFGIQEQTIFNATMQEIFPGTPEIRGGYMYSNDQPGLGVDVDEKLAARFPFRTPGGERPSDRRLDGTIVRP